MELTTFFAQFETLPKEIQRRILNYVEDYLENKSKSKIKSRKTYKFDWESTISLTNEKSVGLQHKANNWR